MDISDLFPDSSQENLAGMAGQAVSQLSQELVRLIDQYSQDTTAVAELYSTWVLPQFIITSKILKDPKHPLFQEAERLSEATGEIEPMIEAYLDEPSRQHLIELSFGWLSARAETERLLSKLNPA